MKQLEAAVDYLTVTSPDWRQIQALVDGILRSVPGLGSEKDFNWMGYKGKVYVGDDSHLAWGTKPGHGLVQMSGGCSDKVLRGMVEFNLLAYKCTRIDLAVTVCLGEPLPLVDMAIADWVEGTRQYSAIVKSNGEGGTLYLGARSGDQFGRMYDKGAQLRSKLKKEDIPLKRLWRYEVEYKRNHARGMLDALSEVIKMRQRLNDFIIGTVHTWFLIRGVAPRFKPSGPYNNVVQVKTRVTSAEKTLDWFSVQVKPAIARVAEEKDIMVIMLALGLETGADVSLIERDPVTHGFQLRMWGIPPKKV